MTAFGPDGHLDEGGAHAFVDGALGTDEAARVIAHVASCGACAGRVAEARGLAAASTRILGALDDVPAGVIPAADAPAATPDPRVTALRDAAARARRARGPGAWAWPVRAAASLLLVAGVGSVVWRATGGRPDAAPPAEATAVAVSRPAAAAERMAAAEQMPAPAPTPAAAPAPDARRVPNAAPLAAEPPPPPAPAPPPSLPAHVAPARAPAPPAATASGAPSEAMSAAAPRAPLAKAAARPGVIAGVVRDAAGRPLEGATVTAGVSGALTDSAGAFVLRDVPEGRAAVRARHIGFAAAATELTVGVDTARAALTLRAESTQLSEVVVAGQASAAAGRAAAGCYAVSAAGAGAEGLDLPAVVRLTPGGGEGAAAGARQRRSAAANDAARADAEAGAAGLVRDARGATRGRWRLVEGALAVTWDGVGEAALDAARDGWDGTLTAAGGPARVTLRPLGAGAAGCGAR